MKLPCLGSDIITLQNCQPTCVRWTSINEGRPLKVFHDASAWDKDYYPNANEVDPIVYLSQAISLWNSVYSCGTLFELTDTDSDADVSVSYATRADDDCGAVGTALCACDDDDDVCVRQLDHSEVFDNFPSAVTMYHVDCVRSLSANQWVNVYVHELGHVLGMGHVYGLSVDSVMGTRPDGSQVVRLFAFDLEQLGNRYPCGCIMVNPLSNTEKYEGTPLIPSETFCPGCQASAYQ